MGDTAAGLGGSTRAGTLFCPRRGARAPEPGGMQDCTARTGVTAPRRGTSEEAASYRLETQTYREREEAAAQIAGSFQGGSCLLW